MRKTLIVLVLLAFCPLLVAQQALSNDSIVKLARSGLSDDLIVAIIDALPGTYDVSADGLIALKAAGCNDKVVSAVWLKASGTARATGAPLVPAQASTANPASTSQGAAQPPTAPAQQSGAQPNAGGAASTPPAEQKDANTNTESFYVTYAAYSNGSDCRMSLVKGHTSYSVVSSVIGCHIFAAGQSVSGRILSHWAAGEWIELQWTDKNGKQKAAQYQIRTYRAVD
jgi:hypothetical protein